MTVTEAARTPSRRSMRTAGRDPSGGDRLIEVRLRSRRLLPVLAGSAVLLSALSYAGQVVEHGLGRSFRGLNTWVRYTDIDLEGNVPAWFQTGMLLVCALALWTLADDSAARKDGQSRHWRVLSLAICYLSLDELTEIHEQTITPIQKVLHTSGLLFFSWILLAVPLLAIFALFYLKFFFRLPAATRIGLVVAGGLYLGGAVGLEMVGGQLWSTVGADTMLYSTAAAAEEALEMFGIISLLVTLGRYVPRDVAPAKGSRGDVIERPPGDVAPSFTAKAFAPRQSEALHAAPSRERPSPGDAAAVAYLAPQPVDYPAAQIAAATGPPWVVHGANAPTAGLYPHADQYPPLQGHSQQAPSPSTNTTATDVPPIPEPSGPDQWGQWHSQLPR